MRLHGEAAFVDCEHLSIEPAEDYQAAQDGEDTAVHGFVYLFIVESQIDGVGV